MMRIDCWIVVLLGLTCSFRSAEAQDSGAMDGQKQDIFHISDAEIAVEISPKSKKSDDLIIKVRFDGEVGDEQWISDVVVFWITPTGEGLSLTLRPVTEKLFAISVGGPLTSGSHILHASLTLRDREGYVQDLYERRYHLAAPSLKLEVKEKRVFTSLDRVKVRATETEELQGEGKRNSERGDLADSSGGNGGLKTFLLLVGLLSLGGVLFFFRSRVLDVAAMAAHIGGGLIEGGIEMAERRGLMKSRVVGKVASVIERISRPFRKNDETSVDKNVKALDETTDGALGVGAAESLGEDLTGQDTVVEFEGGREDDEEGVVFVGEDDDENPNAPAEQKDHDEGGEIDKALVNRDTEGIVVIGNGDDMGGNEHDESRTTDTDDESENVTGNDEPESTRPEPSETGAADDGSIATGSPEPLESEMTNPEAEGESAGEAAGQEVSASSEPEDPDGPSALQETGT